MNGAAKLMPDRRQFLIGGAMLVAAGTPLLLRPAPSASIPATDFDRLIPDRIGPYAKSGVSDIILPPAEDLQSSVYNNVLMRVYAASGLPTVMLLIAQGGAGGAELGVHRPEYCYPAAGFDIVAKRDVALPRPFPGGAQGTLVSARRGDRREQILYWIRIASRYPSSLMEQRLVAIERSLAGQASEGVLMRLSMVSGDPADGLSVLEQFQSRLLASLGDEGRHALLG